MLVLSRDDVEPLLDTDALVDALGAAMVDLTMGRASMPPRVAARVEAKKAILAAMPAHLPSAAMLSTKLVSLFPQNRDRPTHQAVIVCFDADTGTPVALLDGTHITATRTAAGSLLASRHLARPESEVIAVIGTGVQARAHARAFRGWPTLASVLVAGRTPESAAALVDELRAEGVPASVAASPEEAVRNADIVCATTHADEPVVRHAWVRPGTHVNSVGYNTAGAGEVDTELVRAARVVVESRATALAPPPAGAVELLAAIAAGVGDPVAAEIGEIVAGTAPGRTSDDELTLYKSVGVAVQDAAAAALVVRAAIAAGVGTTIEL
jgi:ornithine cyclodeaminase/alanine dehydrogenase-like protein (mu-crystallin family)